jgi:threonylcarbamoyladenosine tRNA methylthiotransferase CDKAL1
MRRKYSIKEFKKIVFSLREKFPDITIATDIICGYPTETNDDFKQTMNLMNKIVPDVMNISKYSAMDGTDAAKLKKLSSEIVKKRSKQMANLYYKLSEKRNKFWKNWQGFVFVNEIGKNNTLVCRK